MEKMMEQLKLEVEALRNQDISHDELGINGFEQAETEKNDICAYMLNILDLAANFKNSVNSVVLKNGLEVLDKFTKDLQRIIEEINLLIGNDIHNEKFPNQRQSFINRFGTYQTQIKTQGSPLETALKIAKLERFANNNSLLEELASQSKSMVEELRERTNQASIILNNLRDHVMRKGLDEATGSFAELSRNHSERDGKWMTVFIIAVMVAIGVTGYTFFLRLQQILQQKQFQRFLNDYC